MELKDEEKNEGKGFSNAQDVVFVDTGLILKAMAGMQKSQEEFQSLREQAELGDTAAYYDLAARYSTGDGVDADPEKAAHWLAMAAEQGDLRAVTALGRCYQTGTGVDPDPARAVR